MEGSTMSDGRTTVEERPATTEYAPTTVEEHPTAVEELPTTVEEQPAAVQVDRPESDRVDGDARRTAGALIPRSRGAVSGVLLAVLGIWGGFVAFVGPYFGYEFGGGHTWVISWNRVWLDVLPGAVLLIGGLTLALSRNRVGAALGAGVALAGGIWFVIGPPVSMVWNGALTPSTAIGEPAGSPSFQALELFGSFYGLGALAIALSAFALGRLSLVPAKDIERAAG
jgi:hypothetical protein